MLFVTYDADRIIRNADFISIAHKGNPQPSARRAVKLKNLKNPRGEAPFTLPFDTPGRACQRVL